MIVLECIFAILTVISILGCLGSVKDNGEFFRCFVLMLTSLIVTVVLHFIR